MCRTSDVRSSLCACSHLFAACPPHWLNFHLRSARRVSTFDLVDYIDAATGALQCRTCKSALKPDVSAASEVSAKEISRRLQCLNSQFGPALEQIRTVEVLLRERNMGEAERETERKMEIDAVKSGQRLARSAAPQLPSANAAVKLQSADAAPKQATQRVAKEALSFLPAARTQVRRQESLSEASVASAAAAAATTAAQSNAAAAAQYDLPALQPMTMRQDEYERLVHQLEAQPSAADVEVDADAALDAAMVSVNGVLKSYHALANEDFEAMSADEQELYMQIHERLGDA